MLKKITVFTILYVSGLCLFGCDDDKDTSNGDDAGINISDEVSLVPPIERDNIYALEMTDGTDTILFECQAAEGGLITKFALNGTQLLSEIPAANQHGSTFWPSPQIWNWPPAVSMPNLASNDYTVVVDEENATIELTSEVDENTGLQFIKRFSPNLDEMAVELSYTIINTSDEDVDVAAWEITRVLPGGITFFPLAEVFDNNLETEEAADHMWFVQPEEGASGDHKLFADGKDGWIAHANPEMVFVKSFNDEPASARAENESEIEIYAKGSTYQEVEQQGPLTTLSPGNESTWKVTWYLRPFPADAELKVGDQALIDFASELGTL